MPVRACVHVHAWHVYVCACTRACVRVGMSAFCILETSEIIESLHAYFYWMYLIIMLC